MRSTEIIILAGGLGTRISPVLGNTPKCLAPIGEHPFLYFLIKYFQRQGIRRFIFSLGHGQAEIETYLRQFKEPLDFVVCGETTPLGTGGAVLQALSAVSQPSVWLANGDSFLAADLAPMQAFFDMCGAECAVALTEVQDASRYGSVELDSSYRITAFTEKGGAGKAWINAGIYLLNKRMFLDHAWHEKFSFEHHYLRMQFSQARFFGYRYRSYFIDIGIPDDLLRAQNELNLYAT